jgi:methylmalonyl-CoA mutase
MAKAIAQGLPKLRIEEAAARAQARIDSGEQTVVGVNKYKIAEEAPLETLKIDNSAVLARQLEKLKRLKAERGEPQCRQALEALSEAARTGGRNLLEAAVEAARAQATVGEISQALERVWNRHVAQVRAVEGVYAAAAGRTPEIERVRQMIEAFKEAEGRAPKILIAKIGQDGHDRGQKIIASAYRDFGFDVVIGALFATPEETAAKAVAEDVHVVGVSTLTAGHLSHVPALRECLAACGRGDLLIVIGGVVPKEDHDRLRAAGVSAIFPPGTTVAASAITILEELSRRLGYAQKAAQ